MNKIIEVETYTNSKDLPIDYLILKLRMLFNNELLEKKIISLDIYKRMQNLLIRKMDKIIIDNSN